MAKVAYSKYFKPGETPQSEKAAEEQVQNSAGGYTFALDKWKALDRFLILGTEGGTYYASEQKLARDAGKCVLECLQEDGVRVVDRIREVSIKGLSYKQDALMYAYAMCFAHGDDHAKGHAEVAFNDIVRTGGQLLEKFIPYVTDMRGWGAVLKRTVANWYQLKEAKDIAFQVTKYPQRGGWSHRDLLRLAKPVPLDGGHNLAYCYVTKGQQAMEELVTINDNPATEALNYLNAVEAVKRDELSNRKIVEAIKDLNLPREVLPTEALQSREVWEALFERMPPTAMIRNIATMTRIGLFDDPFGGNTTTLVNRLTNLDALRKARVHPIQILAALVTYESGRGARGGHTWTPKQRIIQALNDAFYLSFGAIKPTEKRIYLGVDISGSMGMGTICGVPGLTPRHGAAAMALQIVKTEKNYFIGGFTASSEGRVRYGWPPAAYGLEHPTVNGITQLNVHPSRRLDDCMKYMSHLPMGSTDCALPMLHALSEGWAGIDAFVIVTDNETWAGRIHPHEALAKYRAKYNPNAKLIVVGMTATQFTIADPKDSGSLDVVGFGQDTPSAIADFIRS